MESKDKALAEAIVRHLCVGRRICGVTFYAIPMLTIDSVDQHSGELHSSVEIDDGWRVLDDVPSDLPAIEYEDDSDDAVRQKRISELVAAVGYLGWHEIVDARIGDEAPHLLMTFRNGQTLYINGHDDRYESWNIAAGSVAAGNHFLVVAGPEDELAIWCPEGFAANG